MALQAPFGDGGQLVGKSGSGPKLSASSYSCTEYGVRYLSVEGAGEAQVTKTRKIFPAGGTASGRRRGEAEPCPTSAMGCDGDFKHSSQVGESPAGKAEAPSRRMDDYSALHSTE